MLVEAWLDRAVRRRPDHPAVNAMTYAQLDRAAAVGASALVDRGAGPGTTVGLALAPGEAFAAALHATWRAGAIAVPIDLRLTAAERPTCDVVIDEPLHGAGVPGAEREERARRTSHDLDAPAARLYTSGTTSAPRPITITFGNLLWSAIGSSVALGSTPEDRWLCALPVSHVGGLSIIVRSAISATTALVHERFDTDRVLHALREQDVTLVSLVATTLARLLDAGLDHPPALRCALTGGGPLPPALARRALAAGVPVAQTYGLTETCSQTTTAAPGDAEADAGPPLFCTRVRIAGDGEILVSGPTVTTPGELATGDLGRLDADGRLTVEGRKADTIVSGGENVAPQEVEAILAEHAGVAEAAVVGRPDDTWGEAVIAHVVLQAPDAATEAQLRAHCRARLAPFKVPKAVVLVTDLPRTRSGKVRRAALREG